MNPRIQQKQISHAKRNSNNAVSYRANSPEHRKMYSSNGEHSGDSWLRTQRTHLFVGCYCCCCCNSLDISLWDQLHLVVTCGQAGHSSARWHQAEAEHGFSYVQIGRWDLHPTDWMFTEMIMFLIWSEWRKIKLKTADGLSWWIQRRRKGTKQRRDFNLIQR